MKFCDQLHASQFLLSCSINGDEGTSSLLSQAQTTQRRVNMKRMNLLQRHPRGRGRSVPNPNVAVLVFHRQSAFHLVMSLSSLPVSSQKESGAHL